MSAEKKGRQFTRARRRVLSAEPHVRLAIHKRLLDDPRFRDLPGTVQHVLGSVVIRCFDADGKCWLPVESEIPEKLSWVKVTGKSASTVKRAIRAAVEVGLFGRDLPYLRPDYLQGTTTIWLDHDLVVPRRLQGGSTVTQLVEVPASSDLDAKPTRWVNRDPAPRWANSDPPEQLREQEEHLLKEGLVEGANAPAREGTRQPSKPLGPETFDLAEKIGGASYQDAVEIALRAEHDAGDHSDATRRGSQLARFASVRVPIRVNLDSQLPLTRGRAE